ncbi:hypothetical protein MN116_002059 [Schistosoma mekongi]|uniref:Beta-1,4-galactosyltransferase n=1 Tax=Schistosoma mekongi TaxID=38744 RepID=A0AAE2D9D6_SCHME|nr:hypothetical protein MN116_002059 [Schistosoma mekongi]
MINCKMSLSSRVKCLLMMLLSVAAVHLFYSWSAKFTVNTPVFIINYTSHDVPFTEVFCQRSKYLQVGRLKISTKALFWSQIQYKYALSQPVDFIVANSSSTNFNSQQIFASLYIKHNPTKIHNLIDSNSTLKNTTDMNDNVIDYTLPNIWSPVGCSTSLSTAIIIPYRKREQHLRVIIDYMHGFLRHQKIPYTVFVIEQLGNGKFNRGSLLNAGFLEVSKFKEYHCFILHDVDKLPEDDRILYTCDLSPAHLSPLLSTFDYKLLYDRFFGGVVAFTREQYQKINGFSNLYEGWGGEDGDLLMRVEQYGYKLNRPSLEVGRYYAIEHKIDNLNERNPHRYKLLEVANKRFKTDGLNSLKYKVTQSKSMYGGLVYWISINFPDKKEK